MEAYRNPNKRVERVKCVKRVKRAITYLIRLKLS